MSVDSVLPSLGTQAVHPGQDAHGDRNPDSQREGQPNRQPGKGRRDQADPHPVLNDLGQVTGRKINITA